MMIQRALERFEAHITCFVLGLGIGFGLALVVIVSQQDI